MCGSLEDFDYMVNMHPQDGILVRMVSCGMVGMAGVVR